MCNTENAKVSLIITKHPLVVLFMEYPNSQRVKKSVVIAFDLTKPNDVCQLQQLANITGTTYGNFLALDQKYLRLVLEEGSKLAIKAIGHHKRDSFFLTNGNGALMTETQVYLQMGEIKK